MFRKFTTIVDSALVRALDTNETLRACKGFGDCLLYASLVAMASMRTDSVGTQELIRQFYDNKLRGNRRSEVELIDISNLTSGDFRPAIRQAARVEVVISFNLHNRFKWTLSAYRSSDQEPFYTFEFSVGYDGQLDWINVGQGA